MKRIALAATAAVIGLALPASAQDVKQVPRNRTLITQGWDLYNQVPSPANLSPYNGVLLHQRNVLHYTVNEPLFFTNHVTNQLIPWQAEKLDVSADFRDVTITLRPGVRWADGAPFTSADVIFTLETLKANAPAMVMSGPIKEWVESASAPDARTVKIRLTKPGPRWASDTLATGQTTRFIVLPKHVWEGQDVKTFGFYDPAKGWPLGTGPYKVVRSDSNAIIFDRVEKWWAVDSGLVPALPAPERVIYRPATVEALPQLFSANEIDMGRALHVGALEAAMKRNPNLISWNKSGPVWGATAGCTHRLVFNNQSAPFDQAPARQAIAAVIDREQIVNLSWEGSAPAVMAPFASYDGVRVYTKQLDGEIAAAVGKPEAARAERILTQAGFKKVGGKWQLPNGQPWQVTINTQQADPIGPVITRQLEAIGIDAVFRPMQDAPYFDSLAAGTYNAAVFVHCGSLYDPWQTLEHFHSKYAPDAGARAANLRAITRYRNPELDALLDKMEARQPSANDPEYMALVRAAVAIVLREAPQVSLTEEMHPITYNTTYWTGWPTAADPYVAPFQAWEGFALVIHRLKPRQ